VANLRQTGTTSGRVVIEQSNSEVAGVERARRGNAPRAPQLAMAALLGGIAWLATPAIAGAACTTPGNATTACSGNCAAISVGSNAGPPSSTVQIPISFTQGPDDGQSGQGFDEVAAIAFTLGVPGTGDTAPLTFNCTNGDLADGAVTPGAGIASNFTVVVENAQCTNRTRCLCPDTTQGQTLDNFVNIVVYGPKNLPAQGPVNIPVLPSGILVTLNMQIAANAPLVPIPLHIFSALDGNSASKPQFGANLSIGDEAACDVTANSQNRSNVIFSDGTVAVGGTPPPTTPTSPSSTPTPSTPTPGNSCVGDCDGSKTVTINELVIGVNIALGTADASSCVAFEDQNGMVPITQLIKGVNNALNGCPAT
jgi:hypothetical protein